MVTANRMTFTEDINDGRQMFTVFVIIDYYAFIFQ